MSWIDRALARENEILRIIKSFGKSKLDFILVGGYAVSALARQRFSVDCDVVIPKDLAKKFEELLRKEGYKVGQTKVGFDEAYGGEFASFRKKVEDLPVTIDLLIGSLVSRGTSASWSYQYIKENSVNATLIAGKESLEVSVPEKELLVAFKIHAGREADLRDVVMLTRGLDLGKVRKHTQRGEMSKVREQIASELKSLHNPKLVLSLKGVYEIRGDMSESVSRAARLLENLMNPIRESRRTPSLKSRRASRHRP